MNGKPQLPRLKVVYDSECKLCLATVEKLGRMKVKAELAFVPLQKLISGEVPPWPGIEGIAPAQLAAQLHVTDEQGRRFSGADGVLELLRHVPSLAWLSAAGRLPGLYAISRQLYRVIAKYRYQLFGHADCSDGTCSLPGKKSPDGGEHEKN